MPTAAIHIHGNALKSRIRSSINALNFLPRVVTYTSMLLVVVEAIKQRRMSLEVPGQELLTCGKVSLRVNLAASLRVSDAVVARTRVAKYSDFVYRELQETTRP